MIIVYMLLLVLFGMVCGVMFNGEKVEHFSRFGITVIVVAFIAFGQLDQYSIAWITGYYFQAALRYRYIWKRYQAEQQVIVTIK